MPFDERTLQSLTDHVGGSNTESQQSEYQLVHRKRSEAYCHDWPPMLVPAAPDVKMAIIAPFSAPNSVTKGI
jgi:hypothetical protein